MSRTGEQVLWCDRCTGCGDKRQSKGEGEARAGEDGEQSEPRALWGGGGRRTMRPLWKTLGGPLKTLHRARPEGPAVPSGGLEQILASRLVVKAEFVIHSSQDVEAAQVPPGR